MGGTDYVSLLWFILKSSLGSTVRSMVYVPLLWFILKSSLGGTVRSMSYVSLLWFILKSPLGSTIRQMGHIPFLWFIFNIETNSEDQEGQDKISPWNGRLQGVMCPTKTRRSYALHESYETETRSPTKT